MTNKSQLRFTAHDGFNPIGPQLISYLTMAIVSTRLVSNFILVLKIKIDTDQRLTILFI